MKPSVTLALPLALFCLLLDNPAQSALANAGMGGSLDGQKFCRPVAAEGADFGRSPVRQAIPQCVIFEYGTLTDNANEFFGSPPESFPYEFTGQNILNVKTGHDSGYSIQGDKMKAPTTTAILERQ